MPAHSFGHVSWSVSHRYWRDWRVRVRIIGKAIATTSLKTFRKQQILFWFELVTYQDVRQQCMPCDSCMNPLGQKLSYLSMPQMRSFLSIARLHSVTFNSCVHTSQESSWTLTERIPNFSVNGSTLYSKEGSLEYWRCRCRWITQGTQGVVWPHSWIGCSFQLLSQCHEDLVSCKRASSGWS